MDKLILLNATLSNEAHHQILNGKDHMVVPVIALQEGILNGIFYPQSEIEKFAQAWNGVPVPINHPEKDGIRVSANSPEVENNENIGRLFNCNFSDGKLKGEIWINIEKAERLNKNLLERFNKGEMMEVSTGLFGEIVDEIGIWNGATYTKKIINMRPDHLALLPNTEGACSIEDGCGAMRTNAKIKELRDKMNNAIKTLGIKFGFIPNDTSHEDIRKAIQRELDAVKTGESWPWVVEVFENFFIWEDEDKLLKTDYTEKDGVVEISTTHEEVVRQVSYEPILTNQNRVEVNMKKAELVAFIIANVASFSESDKGYLMGLDEDFLQKLKPADNPTETETKTDDVEVKTNCDEETKTNSLSDSDMELFNTLKAREAARVAKLKETIKANHKSLTDEIIDNMDVAALEALASEIKPVANYAAGGFLYNGSGEEKRTHISVLNNLNPKAGEEVKLNG